MVIRLIPQDGHGPVQLLCDNQSDHLVGKGEPGSRKNRVRPLPDVIAETISPTGNKNQGAGYLSHLTTQKFRQFHGGEFPTTLIQENHMISRLYLFQNGCSLLFQSLRLGE